MLTDRDDYLGPGLKQLNLGLFSSGYVRVVRVLIFRCTYVVRSIHKSEANQAKSRSVQCFTLEQKQLVYGVWYLNQHPRNKHCNVRSDFNFNLCLKGITTVVWRNCNAPQ
jgi:hypothetical protein